MEWNGMEWNGMEWNDRTDRLMRYGYLPKHLCAIVISRKRFNGCRGSPALRHEGLKIAASRPCNFARRAVVVSSTRPSDANDRSVFSSEAYRGEVPIAELRREEDCSSAILLAAVDGGPALLRRATAQPWPPPVISRWRNEARRAGAPSRAGTDVAGAALSKPVTQSGVTIPKTLRCCGRPSPLLKMTGADGEAVTRLGCPTTHSVTACRPM